MRRGPFLLTMVAATALLPAIAGFADGGATATTRPFFAAAAFVLLAAAVLATPAPVRPGASATMAIGGGAAFALLTAAGTTWGPGDAGAAAQMQLAAGYWALGTSSWLVLRADETGRSIRFAESILLAGTTAVIAYGLAGEIGLTSLDEPARAGGRLTQPIGYWNAMGALSAIGVVMALRIAFASERAAVQRLLAGAATLVLGSGVALSYSRAAIAAVACGVMVLIALAPRTSRKPRILAGLAAAALLVTPFVVGTISDRDGGSTSFGARSERLTKAGSNRQEYWDVAMSAFAERPIAGHGSGSFAGLWLAERNIDETVRNAHSLPLETAAELGLLGLVLLGLVGLGIARSARRADDEQVAAAIAGLGAWTTCALVDWQWQVPAVTGTAVVLAAVVLASERSEPSR